MSEKYEVVTENGLPVVRIITEQVRTVYRKDLEDERRQLQARIESFNARLAEIDQMLALLAGNSAPEGE
jgi:ABC-type proline/glycine betaine transport system substrate-binding protein